MTVSLTVAVIKLMSSPVLQLNKEIALLDILRIPKYDTAAISSGKMDSLCGRGRGRGGRSLNLRQCLLLYMLLFLVYLYAHV